MGLYRVAFSSYGGVVSAFLPTFAILATMIIATGLGWHVRDYNLQRNKKEHTINAGVSQTQETLIRQHTTGRIECPP